MTQIDVFEDSNAADSELLQTQGVDLQSPEEMFHTVYEKVFYLEHNIYGDSVIYIYIYIYIYMHNETSQRDV